MTSLSVLQVIMILPKKFITCVWYISKPIKLCNMCYVVQMLIHLFIDVPMYEYMCIALYSGTLNLKSKRKQKRTKRQSAFIQYLITYYKVAFLYKSIRFIETLFLLENKCTYLYKKCCCCHNSKHITIRVLATKLCLILNTLVALAVSVIEAF